MIKSAVFIRKKMNKRKNVLKHLWTELSFSKYPALPDILIKELQYKI